MISSRAAVAEGVLAEITESKRSELAGRLAGIALDSLRARARPTGRSLADALSQPGSRFILEIKKASPSAGSIRPAADVSALARGYSGVADALSVLTEERHFRGSLEDLALARRDFDGPILAKDFFLDPRQVVEARIAGADAVLVMLSLVDDSLAAELIAEARRVGMDALVEVHDECEMRRANALGANIIGINNRDLRDLSIDLRTTERLAHLARGRVVVAESGIRSSEDVERLSRHVDAFLVGSSLMASDSPAEAARKLVFGRVKMCGLRQPEDVLAAAPATFAGFVFVPGSPRHLTAEAAAPLAGVVRKRGMLPVGIFKNAPSGIVTDIATLLNLHAIQLHGTEDETYVRRVRRSLADQCEVWTAVPVGTSSAIGFRGGDRTLFDSGPGGTGRSFDWRIVGGSARLPRALLAGGIGAANARAAAAVGAYAIDVGSSTDALPGVKSERKIRALFEALRPDSKQEQRLCA
jgi:indole-3-glycerol phosphate synthase/phosphoribosylanthranilate isomerase